MKSSVWFTQAEIKQIVEATTGQYKVLFHLAGYTGLRSGELVGLRVEDLKLEHGVIEVHRAVWNGIEGDTKTKAKKPKKADAKAVVVGGE